MGYKAQDHQWQFIDQEGTFRLEDPQLSTYLYFPLVNEVGMKSAVTPLLKGAINFDHDTFLTEPLCVEDLHNTRSARNFWVYVEGFGPWSVTGNSAAQIAERFSEEGEKVSLEAGMLWHAVKRTNAQLGLQARITNFVPASADRVELMRVSVTNTGSQPCTLTPTAAVPIYGRSADNLRDHRHVTSLLHRIHCNRQGVIVQPTMSFDERGHRLNETSYIVLGCDDQDDSPEGFFPVVDEYIGEGGTLDWPLAIVENQPPFYRAGDRVDGREALGGLRFRALELSPGETRSWFLIMAISEDDQPLQELVNKYGSKEHFEDWLGRTKKAWKAKLDILQVETGDPDFNRWIRWVSVQPILRRIFGNSFLPYHDYGRGGRGWRDLWQDVLPQLLTEPENVVDVLFNNFLAVRIDGSNANIIGSRPGEFKTDRNQIPRVWMDHGVWPLQAVKLYIDQTGDLGFLLRETPYFKDYLVHRAEKEDDQWKPADGTQLKTAGGSVYQGSVLEHLLVQHLSAFFNVGEHNILRLENGDWNDGFDMAAERGESVAFTAYYASNLGHLGTLVRTLRSLGLDEVSLCEELMILLDRIKTPVDYGSWMDKRERLEDYLTSVEYTVSGTRVEIPLEALAADLEAKSEHLRGHLRSQEWIEDEDGYGWFNGYYDNQGQRLEGTHPQGTRMTLTGQVFPVMGGIATDHQVQEIVQAVNHYLADPQVGGIRLNTDFGEYGMNVGRAFGFAYGHKENGAMFSHMAVMYANALYQRGLVEEGYHILDGIYQQSVDFSTSRIYPGIPEYFNNEGRGMYPYLTGSASWYLLTLVSEVFGVRGRLGDLVLKPRLLKAQFDRKGEAHLDTVFASRKLHLSYQNPHLLDYNQYKIVEITRNGERLDFQRLDENGVLISRSAIEALSPDRPQTIFVKLGVSD
ncbi:MAG: GH36-type glycosyl hydrolase domain-containing protein [Chloroflexota bacterium]